MLNLGANARATSSAVLLEHLLSYSILERWSFLDDFLFFFGTSFLARGTESKDASDGIEGRLRRERDPEAKTVRTDGKSRNIMKNV